ncbi:MAG: tetratricopeptide repeat protein [Bacteroidales bacterium]|nr:tetratricopeptide repeat protein [Bacteroidales bacterium]
MKKIKSYLILFIAAAVMSSCSGLNKMKTNADQVNYKIVPEVLETHAGEVEVTIQGTFPEKYFDKNTVLEATPVLTYQGGETAFESVKVQGEKVQDNFKVISYEGGNFSYSGTVPFKDEMRVSDLVLRITATRKGTSLDFDAKKLADGVIATSTLVDADPRPIAMTDNFQRIVPEEMIADIHFLINMANIRSNELKEEDINTLKEYLETVKGDERMEFKGTAISAYASPDGEIDFNDKLSKKRAETALEYIKREFEKAQIEDVNKESFLESRSTAEDWEGFREEVSKSNMADKELILRVLSMYSDPVVREREIKNISAAFETLKTDILPKLRRSKIIVNVDKIGRTDDEILEAINGDASVLGLEELLYAGTLTEDLNEQLEYYKIAAERFPKCLRAHNNIGVTEMHLGNIDAAEAAFEKAQAIQNNDMVKNNLGYVALAQGDIAEAEELFNSVATPTMESRSGQGIIAIMNGEYDKAVNLFGNDPSVNHALALVLKGDLNRAKSMLDGMEMPVNGSGSYLKAVVGARMDNADYMLDGLREAVRFNPDWAAYAAKDVEFAKFAGNEALAAIIQ